MHLYYKVAYNKTQIFFRKYGVVFLNNIPRTSINANQLDKQRNKILNMKKYHTS